MRTTILILFAAINLALPSLALAGGGDCIVTGTVHHVATTENKIVFIVSGECSLIGPKREGYLKFPMDHGVFIIARLGQPHSGDSND